MGALTTEGIPILMNEWGGGGGLLLITEGILILINESEGGCLDNRRYFNTNE